MFPDLLDMEIAIDKARRDVVFHDDVCHCIECAVTAPLESTEPYDYIPTEEEKEEIEANFLDDAGVGRM